MLGGELVVLPRRLSAPEAIFSIRPSSSSSLNTPDLTQFTSSVCSQRR